MATEDPPSMIPRIVGILDPETGHYSVVVRVPVDLKLKYPDEPWRTGIADIGLPKRESDKYDGYVLVDFLPASPTGESSDILWVFEKLDSPHWNTRTHSRAGLIPNKFQSFVTETKTEYDTSPLADLTPLTGDVVFSRIEDKEATGKARKTDVTEEISEDISPLEGELTDTWGVNTTEESLVVDGTPTDSGYGVKDARVVPLGNGKSIKFTERYPADEDEDGIIYTLEGESYDESSEAVVYVRKSLVDASQADTLADAARADDYIVEIQPLDKWHSIMVSSKIVDLPPASLGELTDTWGVNTTEKELVDDGAPTEYGFGVKEGRVVPLSNGKSVKFTERYPEPAEEDVIYTLEGQDYDESSKAVIDVTKSLVSATAAESLANARRDVGEIVEIRPLDKWHSILISSKIADLPEMQEWDETIRIDLPNKLLSVGVVWDAKDGGYENASGVDNIPLIQADNLPWKMAAQAQASASCFGSPFIEIEPGYNGPAVARVTREFFDDPPILTAGDIHIFRPVTGILTIRGFSIDSSQVSTKSGIGSIAFGSDISNRLDKDNKLSITNFGPFEHDGLSPVVDDLGDSPNVVVTKSASAGSSPASGVFPAATVTINETASATVEFAASSIPLVTGDTYVANIIVRPWRAGKWVRETYTVTVP